MSTAIDNEDEPLIEHSRNDLEVNIKQHFVFDKREALINYLKGVSPFALYSFVVTGSGFLNLMWMSSFKHGLEASAYIAGMEAVLLSPVTCLMVVAVNVTGAEYGKLSKLGISLVEAEQAKSNIGDVFRDTSGMAIVTAIPCIAILVSAKHILLLLDQPPDAVEIAQLVFYPMAIGVIPQLLFRGQGQVALGLAKTKPLFFLLTTYSGLFALLGYAMMKGIPGVTIGLGPAGYGYAYTIASFLSSGALIGHFYWGKHYRPYHFFSCKRFDENSKKILKDMLKMGWSVALNTFFEEVGLVMASIMVGQKGDEDLAVSQAVAQYVFCATTFIGYGAGISSGFVSQARGEGNPLKVRFIGNIGIMFGVLSTSIGAVMFFIAPKQLASVFTSNPRIQEATRSLFMIQGASLVLDAARNYGASSARGGSKYTARETEASMLLNGLSLLLFGGIGWSLGFPAGMGVNGIFLGRTTSIFITGALQLERWRKVIKKETKVEASLSGQSALELQLNQAASFCESKDEYQTETPGKQSFFSSCLAFFTGHTKRVAQQPILASIQKSGPTI